VIGSRVGWCGRFLVLQIGCIIIGNSNLYKDEGSVFNPESVVDTMKAFQNMKCLKCIKKQRAAKNKNSHNVESKNRW